MHRDRSFQWTPSSMSFRSYVKSHCNFCDGVNCAPAPRRGVMARIGWGMMSGGIGRLVVLTGLPGSGKTTLAIRLAGSLPACRMCPDDWMVAAGIDLWDDAFRVRIEAFQLICRSNSCARDTMW